MKTLPILILTLLVLGGCASTPPDPSKDFKATASAPDLEQYIDEGNCWAGCKDNITFSGKFKRGINKKKNTVTKVLKILRKEHHHSLSLELFIDSSELGTSGSAELSLGSAAEASSV